MSTINHRTRILTEQSYEESEDNFAIEDKLKSMEK